MTKKRQSKRGGKSSNFYLPSPLGRELKRIMITTCDLCTIGIGTSMQKMDKVWQQYRHDNKEIYKFRYKKKTYRLCEGCFERVQTDPTRLK